MTKKIIYFLQDFFTFILTVLHMKLFAIFLLILLIQNQKALFTLRLLLWLQFTLQCHHSSSSALSVWSHISSNGSWAPDTWDNFPAMICCSSSPFLSSWFILSFNFLIYLLLFFPQVWWMTFSLWAFIKTRLSTGWLHKGEQEDRKRWTETESHE